MGGFLDRMAGLAFQYCFVFAVVALLVLVGYAAGSACGFANFFMIAGILLSLALGCGAAGAIVGFLFGIPHSLPEGTIKPQPPATTPGTSPVTTTSAGGAGATPTTPGMPTVTAQPATNAAPPIVASATAAPTPVSPPAIPASERIIRNTNYGRSTNLEQIADWLTKIIVGVGLIELRKIIARADALCLYMGEALKGHGILQNGSVIAGCVLVSFFVTGFLIAYLWTYLYLLEITDRASEKEFIIASVNQTIHDNDDRNKLATDQANTQLNLPFNADDLPLANLTEAFRGASKNVCSMIFFHAVGWRKQFYKDPATRFRVARTIPIFRALISLDKDFEYPENYLQLGYALKDNSDPDFAGALENIDKAIRNFDRASGRIVDVSLAYFNRAFCRIKLDMGGNPPQKSSDLNKKLILADLATAGQDEYIKEIIDKDLDVLAWKTLNIPQLP